MVGYGIERALALSEFAELHVVNAWLAVGELALRTGRAMLPPSEVEKYVEGFCQGHQQVLDALSRHLGEPLGSESMAYLKPRQHLIKGAAQEVIPNLAAELNVDLVVMGTVGRTGISGFLIGNTAETILNRLDCSVLAVKPKGFISPICLEEGDLIQVTPCDAADAGLFAEVILGAFIKPLKSRVAQDIEPRLPALRRFCPTESSLMPEIE